MKRDFDSTLEFGEKHLLPILKNIFSIPKPQSHDSTQVDHCKRYDWGRHHKEGKFYYVRATDHIQIVGSYHCARVLWKCLIENGVLQGHVHVYNVFVFSGIYV